MRIASLVLLAASLAACGPRQAEVRTAPQVATEVSLRVVNSLSQAVNVYVVKGGDDIFIRQVAANSTDVMNVPGVAAGTTVKLKANPVDGTQSYTRDNVTLSGTYEWRVP